MGQGGGPLVPRPGRPRHQPGASHWGGQRIQRPTRRGGVRRGKPSRRSAQTLAHPRSQGLPARVRLFMYVLVGDGSYLMMSQEIVTSIQEGYKLNIVVIDNHGFSSIGGLSRACGSGGFGTEYRYRKNGKLEGEFIELDLAANAASLGACAVRAETREELSKALSAALSADRTSVIVIETDLNQRVPGYESWWDVPIAETSQLETVRTARKAYEEGIGKERYFFRKRGQKKEQEASLKDHR